MSIAWKETCAKQNARLEIAMDTARHALELCNNAKASGWIKPEDRDKLQRTMGIIDKKRQRLCRGEFHIAVVGSEKAGKSTFINAWLSCDLLPNKPTRCTFTTTRLHSVEAKSEQRLEVFPKTTEEMQRLVETLKQEENGSDASVARNASDDLKHIHENKDNLNSIVTDGNKKFSFTDLDEIRGLLEKYAADPCYAHAIRQLDLYTCELASMDGILFYDVPGLNSGLLKHKTETKEMLEDSDAVIIVKFIKNPSIDGSEKELFRYIQEGDASVSIKNKVFLFASQVDSCITSYEGLNTRLQELKQSCTEFCLADDKILVGAPGALLYLTGRLRNFMDYGPPEAVKERLKAAFNLSDTEDDTIFRATGISTIQARIERYLETERTKILEDSCSSLVSDVQEASRNIRAAVARHVPENSDTLRQKHDEDLHVNFSLWWNDHWHAVKSEIGADKEAFLLVQEKLNSIHDTYTKDIKEKLDELHEELRQGRQEHFMAVASKYGNQPDYINANWRREVVFPKLMKFIQQTGLLLSVDLYAMLDQYMTMLMEHFYEIVDVKAVLLEESEIADLQQYSLQLKSSLSALYLRFARPLVECLIRYPLNVPDRSKQCTELGPDLNSVENYYAKKEDGKEEYRLVKSYAKHGNYLFTDQNLRRKLGIATLPAATGIVEHIADKTMQKISQIAVGSVGGGVTGVAVATAASTIALHGAKILDNAVSSASSAKVNSGPAGYSLKDVTEEVDADFDALREYLLYAVFDASGITAFARQEFDHLRNGFLDNEVIFRGKVSAAYMRQDAALLAHMPPDMCVFEFDTHVSELLHQLSISLSNSGTA